MPAAKSNAVKVNLDRVDRLAAAIIAAINRHLDEEPMIGAEIALALNKVAYTIAEAWQEAQKEIRRGWRTAVAA